MPILNCFVDDRTMATLERVSRETGRTIEDLAEAAISDQACRAGLEPAVDIRAIHNFTEALREMRR